MSQRLFFMGIGGTLMGSLALLARQMGASVSGFDRALYPPMSDQLADAGIDVFEGFAPSQLRPAPDLVVIGNAQLPRGHAAVEYVLNHNLPYASGAEWLGNAVLRSRWPIAAAGTHGKTTTASMVAHILACAGYEPGFLIGGVPANFGVSSRLGSGQHFVVEADEYDTSYFDRRSKFVHYRPRTLIVNNLELDHADIFADVAQIQMQFHHLVRTVPGNGLIVVPQADRNVDEMLRMGCWTPLARFAVDDAPGGAGVHGAASEGTWQAADVAADASSFAVLYNGSHVGGVSWALMGRHNVANALAALAAASHAGVAPQEAAAALGSFASVKRRMELIVDRPDIKIYDDFAHHPTAIRTTLEGIRAGVGDQRVVAVIEPRTHTMSLGTLRADLSKCCSAADEVIWFRGANIGWDVDAVARACPVPAVVADDIERLAAMLVAKRDRARPAHVVLMSNGAFGGIYKKLVQRLTA